LNTPICCDDCERPLNVPPELIGRVVKCPNCGNILSVASPSAETPLPSTQQNPLAARLAPQAAQARGEGRAWAVIVALASLPLFILLLGVALWLLLDPAPRAEVAPPTVAVESPPPSQRQESALAAPTFPKPPPTPGVTVPKPPPTGPLTKPPRIPSATPIQPVVLDGPDISPGWRVVLRSSDPTIWNKDVHESDQHFAVPLSKVPADVTYVRVRHDKEFVITAITKSRLTKPVFTGDCGWNGVGRSEWGDYRIGILKKSARSLEKIEVRVAGPDIYVPYDGWGFGRPMQGEEQLGCSWGAQLIPPAVLEIAVKSGGLTEAEQKQVVASTVRIDPIDPPELAGGGISTDWTVLFRSADPSLWDREMNRDANHFARPLAQAPEDLRYLRLRKNGEYVILAITKPELKKLVDKGAYTWQGTAVDNSNALHLGISARKMELHPRGDRGATSILFIPFHTGWGFGHKHWLNDGQGYCWDGKSIPATVFEIAVKPGDLTEGRE
jgi:hypothetical protein